MDVDDRPIGMNGRDRAEPNPRAGGRAPWAEIPAQAAGGEAANHRPAGPSASRTGRPARTKKGPSGQIVKGNEFSFFFQKQYLYEFDEYLNEFE
jgi:hypothetical protein